MYSMGELNAGETLSVNKVKDLLIKRVEAINLDLAKEDVKSFLKDPTQLDAWTPDFFRHWINHLKFDNQ